MTRLIAIRAKKPSRSSVLSGGFNDNPDPSKIRDDQFSNMLNMYRDNLGNLASRPGYYRKLTTKTGFSIRDIHHWVETSKTTPIDRIIFAERDATSTNITMEDAGISTQLKVFTTSDLYFEAQQADDMLFLASGSDTFLDQNWKIHNDAGTPELTSMGIAAPTAAPTTSGNIDGSLEQSATYQYMYTFYDSSSKTESNPSPALSTTTGATGILDGVALTGITVDADSAHTGTDQRRIYRTLANGSIFKLEATIADNVTTTYSSINADSTLGSQVEEDHYILPAGEHILAVRGRMWVGHEDSSMIEISKPGQFEYWDSTNTNASVEIRKDDGQKVRALASLFENVFVFKENSIHSVNQAGGSAWVIHLMAEGVGCIASRSMQRASDLQKVPKLFFMGNDAVYEFNGAVPTPISFGVLDQRYKRINRDALKAVTSAVDVENHWYILGVPLDSDTSPTERWVYDYVKKAWYIFQDAEAEPTALGAWKDSTTSRYFVMAGDVNGYVRIYKPGFHADAHNTGTIKGTATSGTPTTLVDTGAAFFATGSGLIDLQVKIVSGTGKGQVATITNNDATSLTVASWSIATPDSTSVYHIGPIRHLLRSKWFDGTTTRVKVIREIEVDLIPQSGTPVYNLTVNTYSSLLKDDFSTITVADDTFSIGTAQRHHILNMKGRGTWLNLEFDHIGAEEPIEISAFAMQVQLKGKI